MKNLLDLYINHIIKKKIYNNITTKNAEVKFCHIFKCKNLIKVENNYDHIILRICDRLRYISGIKNILSLNISNCISLLNIPKYNICEALTIKNNIKLFKIPKIICDEYTIINCPLLYIPYYMLNKNECTTTRKYIINKFHFVNKRYMIEILSYIVSKNLISIIIGYL